jgi:subtilisin family serine protease
MANFSSRGPTMIDFAAKPDLVAPGTGTVSLADKGSLLYMTKAAYLLPAKNQGLKLESMPYLTLSGTSMAAPVVAGTVALMLEANPALTPNLVKAILQFTSQVYPGYNYLTQGAGFLNTLGAVRLSRYFATAHKGDAYPSMTAWSRHIFWGNRRVAGGVLTPGGTAWANNVSWGADRTPSGQNIVWGENCFNATATTSSGATTSCGASTTPTTTSSGATPMATTSCGATATATTSSGATAMPTTLSGATRRRQHRVGQ